MLNKNKILMMAVIGAIANLPGANAQTFYQCMPCGAGSYDNNGVCTKCPAGKYSTGGAAYCSVCEDYEYTDINRARCLSVNEKDNWKSSVFASVSAGYCTTKTINHNGLFVVYLRGGKGGNGGSCVGNDPGKNGGYVQYKFTVTAGTSIELCAGGNGKNASGTAGGGGAGSWIKIGEKYIVAGGGGGGGNLGGESNDAKGQAGGGGAIGAGGSGDDFSCDAGCSGSGGSVGKYSGGAGQCGKHDGVAGDGIDDYNKGKGGRFGGGYGVGGIAYNVPKYSHYNNVWVGGAGKSEGSATHESNIKLQLGCLDENIGCAELYEWRYN